MRPRGQTTGLSSVHSRFWQKKAGIYGMLGGQVVDVESEGLPLEREKLDFIYDLKTGALIELLC